MIKEYERGKKYLVKIVGQPIIKEVTVTNVSPSGTQVELDGKWYGIAMLKKVTEFGDINND